jgi:hypothetical protein
LNTIQTSFSAVVMVGWSTNRKRPLRSLAVSVLVLAGSLMLAMMLKWSPPSVLSAIGTKFSTF